MIMKHVWNPRLASIFVATVALAASSGCAPVPIETDDDTQPGVTITVKGPNGYEETDSVVHKNSNAQEPIVVACKVEDPQGVKFIKLFVSDNAVDSVICGGNTHPSGNYILQVMPQPMEQTFSGSSGNAPKSFLTLFELPGTFTLVNSPEPDETCVPTNDTHITIQCTGQNWSKNVANSTKNDFLQVNFD